jgi:soluble lytic murein transglycosylase
LLAEVNADYLFRVFMYHFDDEMQTPEEQAMITDIALEYFQIRQAVRAAKAGRLQGMILAERAYPLIDLPDAAPMAPEAALTYSVIRQETEFDPQAVSGAGARGLMQMMPATARQTARQLDMPYSFQWLTDDPGYNLTLGMAHLQEVVTITKARW